MWISQREATRRLAEKGFGYGESRRVLEAGLAGEPVRTPHTLLYEAAQVDALCSRAPVLGQFSPPCDAGFLVMRGGNAQLDRDHRVHWAYGMAAALRLRADGWLPLVVTLSGFVTTTREVTVLRGAGTYRLRLETRAAGEWGSRFEGRLFPLGRGPSLQWHGRDPWEGLGKR